jgi:hypothetical protein
LVTPPAAAAEEVALVVDVAFAIGVAFATGVALAVGVALAAVGHFTNLPLASLHCVAASAGVAERMPVTATIVMSLRSIDNLLVATKTFA